MYVPELIRKEGLRRGLSIRTIKTYKQCVRQFFKHCSKDPRKVNKKDIKGHLDYLIERGSAGNTVNVYLNALKFFYNEVLNKRLMVRIRFSRTPKTKPVFLTKEEMKRLFESIGNPKHRLMVKLIYSAGLRVGELVHLRAKDFEFNQNYGWVRKGKGSKDRPFIIAESLKADLIDYASKNCNDSSSWLFNGQKENHISVMTVQKIVREAARKAGITKNVHPHTLRHSFATHLIDNGNRVIEVQSLLGHSSIETTRTYLHTAHTMLISVKSPLDTL